MACFTAQYETLILVSDFGKLYNTDRFDPQEVTVFKIFSIYLCVHRVSTLDGSGSFIKKNSDMHAVSMKGNECTVTVSEQMLHY